MLRITALPSLASLALVVMREHRHCCRPSYRAIALGDRHSGWKVATRALNSAARRLPGSEARSMLTGGSPAPSRQREIDSLPRDEYVGASSKALCVSRRVMPLGDGSSLVASPDMAAGSSFLVRIEQATASSEGHTQRIRDWAPYPQ
jgi:hypothetical protein